MQRGPDHPEGETISRWFVYFSVGAGLNVFPCEISSRSELRSSNISEKIWVLQPPPSSAHRVPPICTQLYTRFRPQRAQPLESLRALPIKKGARAPRPIGQLLCMKWKRCELGVSVWAWASSLLKDLLDNRLLENTAKVHMLYDTWVCAKTPSSSLTERVITWCVPRCMPDVYPMRTPTYTPMHWSRLRSSGHIGAHPYWRWLYWWWNHWKVETWKSNSHTLTFRGVNVFGCW